MTTRSADVIQAELAIPVVVLDMAARWRRGRQSLSKAARVDLSETILVPGSVAQANRSIESSSRWRPLPNDAVWLAHRFFREEQKSLLPALTADATVARTARTRRINMKMTTIVGIFDNARDLDKAVESTGSRGI